MKQKFSKPLPLSYKSREREKISTSWENVASRYNDIVNKDGHFYHNSLIMPLIKQHLDVTKNIAIADLGCGQGVLSRHLPKKISYLGVDISSTLISQAKKYSQRNPLQNFLVHDLCTNLDNYTEQFDYALAILSLQNMQKPSVAIANAFNLLKTNGSFIVILNHPCFRIPRQTHWHFDESQHTYSRRINAYLTPKIIPINMNPSEKNTKTTTTFHFPLSYWINALSRNNFSYIEMEELVSNKTSTGSRSKAENNIRKEIPLFLILKAKKILA